MKLDSLINAAKGIREYIHWSELVALGVLMLDKIYDHHIFVALGIPYNPVDIICNFLIFILILDNFRQVTEFIYRKRRGYEGKQTDNLIIGLTNVYLLIIFFSIASTGLALFGVSLSSFFTSISIVAAALAVLSKDYISSIISGMIITFSDEISVGDYVEIGTNKGKIIDMNLSRLIMLSEDDEVVYIPNNTVFNSNIINHTKKTIKKTHIDFTLEWKFVKSVEEFEAMLVSNLEEFKEFIDENSYALKVTHIKWKYIELKFQYQLKKYDRSMEKAIKRKIERKIVQLIGSVPEM